MANKPFPLAYADPAGLATLPSPTTTQAVLVVDGADIKVAASNTLTAATGGGGAGVLPVATKTAAYTLTTADRVILANTSGGAFTLTLPTPSGATGIPFQIKQKAGANTLTVAPTTGTIDGAGALVFPGANAAYTFVSDGSNYYVF